ncbi:NADPH-dependent FMN reductase [Oceanicola sp. 22II-s10i]|uniref:NADPH-dependent FMN reductase n=1 Tax=Oceanicola sp. 22II-s10i TaxID=1317116 RepID=UPI001C3D959C|nr:NADPH-dependent FMN reductase [Oceanicola sp. 22II-s10i]
MKIAGFVGSLRRAAYSGVVMDTLIELRPEGMEIERLSIGDLPLYNEDLKEDGSPRLVIDLADKVRAADGVLIVTPEYNRSFSGVLKNALDWISTELDMPFRGKPTAIVSQSTGMRGGALANYHLRQTLSVIGAAMLTGPEAAVAQSGDLVKDGRIEDERTRKRLRKELDMLAEAIARAG